MKRISLLALVLILACNFVYAEKKVSSKKIIVQDRITNLGNQSEIGISIHNLEKGDSLTFDLVFDSSLLHVEKVAKDDATISWQKPEIDNNTGAISSFKFDKSQVPADNKSRSKLVTIIFQSLKTGKSEIKIKNPQLSQANGVQKLVEVVTGTVTIFPQANLIQALKQLNVDNIFATKSKAKNTKKKKGTTSENQLIQASNPSKKLTVDDIFPTDQVLDVQITVDQDDWDIIRYQGRDVGVSLSEERKYAPLDRPYTYVEATVSINGVVFPQVGIRKKAFNGSKNPTRPSLKIKLNHVDKKGQIDGLTNLTFNNNQQDVSLISQFMGYGLFNAADSPAPRCAYAKLTVNGQNLGLYSHVERIHRPLLQRAFGNQDGVLYEGTLVDFLIDWEGSFEHKFGNDKLGRKKIKELIKVLNEENEDIEQAIGRLVDLDSFYTFWVMEGLLSFWDGYSGNRNNFFIYLNPETNKFHFIPWGADSLFERFSPIKDDSKDPASVKKQGLITHRLYQLESGRQRYEQVLRNILEHHWDEKALLMETERIETLVKPYLVHQTKAEIAQIVQEEARGWIEWLRKNPAEAREEALNSRDFRRLPTGAQQAIMEAMQQIEDEEKERGENQETEQFITDWSLLGPFYTQKSHDLDQDFLLEQGGEGNIQPNQDQEFRNSKNQVLKWHPISGREKIINLIKKIGRLNDVTAYAFCQIEGSGEEYVEFGLGSDDSVKVWINGQVVHQYQGGRGVMIDQDRFTVKLNQGKNQCLVKVSQGMGDWGFVIRPVDRFPLDEGIVLSGQLILKGENKDKFPPIRLQAVSIDSDGTTYSQDWGFLVNGNRYQRVVHSAKGIKLRLQAMAGSEVLAVQDIELELGQEEAVDLIIDTESPAALKFLNMTENRSTVAQSAYRFFQSLERSRQFIRNRRSEIMEEIANGMPKWEKNLGDPSWWIQPSMKPSIWTAAATGRIKAAKQHLAKGMDINAKDAAIFDQTPLSIAVGAGQSKMVKFLIQQGADVNTKNGDGGTALHGAAFLGRSKSAKLLIENGANIKAKDSSGATAMDNLKTDWATTQFISQLLQIGVDREAVERGRAKVAELLRQ